MAIFKYLLLLTFSHVYAFNFNITCHYYGYDWNSWGEHYTCLATLEDVVLPLFRGVDFIVGDHKGSNTNNDVQAVEIHGQRTFYIIRGLVQHFPNMKELYVFRSDLRRLSQNDFKEYTQLTTISLSRNRLTSIPDDAFDDLINLEYLSLSFNALTAVPNLKRLKTLKGLYLFENSIETLLATDFEGNEKLEIIWLYRNKIRYIDSAGIFDYAPNLRLADLTNNRCIDMKYHGHEDDIAFNEVINRKCQLRYLGRKLYDFI